MTDAAALAPRRTPLMRRLPPSLRKLLRNRAFVSGFVLLTIVVVVSVLAPLLSPDDPNHMVIRARELGRSRVLFGFGASLEKRRMGARPEAASIYLEADDHYVFEALATIASESPAGDA